MLVQLPRLHEYIRNAHTARPRLGGGHWAEASQSRTDGNGYGWRRRRFRDWWQPFRPFDAPQCGPALHRHGQPDLWPYHRPDVANQPRWYEDQEHDFRKYRSSRESDFSGS